MPVAPRAREVRGLAVKEPVREVKRLLPGAAKVQLPEVKVRARVVQAKGPEPKEALRPAEPRLAVSAHAKALRRGRRFIM